MKVFPGTHSNLSLQRLLKSPYFILYVTIYTIALALLYILEGFNLALPLFILLFIGIGVSSVAWWSTRHITPPTFSVEKAALECGVLAFYLIFGIGGYLIWGMNFIESTFPDESFAKLLVLLVSKLSAFVIVPLLLFRMFWGYRLPDLVQLSFDWKKHLSVVLWISLIMIPFQLMLGNGLSQLREAGFAGWQLILGFLISSFWVVIEVGLVEEIPYRILLQSRLAALFKSEVAGLVLMLLLFGLTHAPGLYFRRGGAIEAVGSTPSALMAIGYSIVIISMVSFFLGVLWIRTKNLMVLILVHAMFDLVPRSIHTLNVLFVK